MQKALCVDAIKSLDRIAKAIGDVSNDATMLSSFHIGIDIIGKKGMKQQMPQS